MKTTLITGGAGFIGSHLADALVGRGEAVVALDDLSTGLRQNVAHLIGDPSRFRLVESEVEDEAITARLVRGCDHVIHLAAAVGVKLIVSRPVRTIQTNVHATEVVLDAARRHDKPIIIASSSEVYGKGTDLPFTEESDLVIGPSSRARWAYACSKALDEFLALAHHRESGLAATVARFFNTVGPRQRHHYGMVIPTFVRQALRGEPITVFGEGRQTRCFCHVEDVVRALLALRDHPGAAGEIFNIGSTEEISIQALAQRVRARAGSSSDLVLVPYDEAYPSGFEDMARRVPCTRKIRAAVGWSPKVGLDQILDDVIAQVRRGEQ